MAHTWSRRTLANAMRALAERFIRIRQSNASDELANDELVAASVQGARLYSEAGKMNLEGFCDLTPPTDEWDPPFDRRNPLHRLRVEDMLQYSWLSVLCVYAERSPDRVGGGSGVGGSVYELDHYDPEDGVPLGVRHFDPTRWREFAEDSASVCIAMADRLMQAEAPSPANPGVLQPARYSAFVASSDPRVTSCDAWKSLMQFRNELLTNPRRDAGKAGWWSRWIGTMQRWLYGGGNWGDGYYAPSHRVTTPDCAVALDDVHYRLHEMFTPGTPYSARPGDDRRTMLFPANTAYSHPGVVIDWDQPFPPLGDRGPLVEWVESWIDRIQYTESTGRYPWEGTEGDDELVGLAADRAPRVTAKELGRGGAGGHSNRPAFPVDVAPTFDPAPDATPTAGDLASVAGISDDTFRRVRQAAGIEVKLRGAAARNRRYNPSEVDRLIAASLAGNFIERTSMAEKWARWASKKAASKPHARR